MPTGRHRPERPEKNNHQQNFDRALADALRQWNPADGENASVRLEVSITPNPGGVNEYGVVLD